jgi:hypothetical protein
VDWPLWVEDGGGWGFAAGGEGVFAPTEYEWGNRGRRGTKAEQCIGLRRACLKFGESYKLCPHLKFRTYCGLVIGQSCQVSQMWAGYISAERMGRRPRRMNASLASW